MIHVDVPHDFSKRYVLQKFCRPDLLLNRQQTVRHAHVLQICRDDQPDEKQGHDVHTEIGNMSNNVQANLMKCQHKQRQNSLYTRPNA